MTSIEISELLKNNELLHATVKILWSVLGVLFVFGTTAIGFLIKDVYGNKENKLSINMIISEFKEIIPKFKEDIMFRIDEQDNIIESAVMEELKGVRKDYLDIRTRTEQFFTANEVSHKTIIDMIQPMLNETSSIEGFSQQMDMFKRDIVNQLQPTDVHVINMIQISETCLLDFYKIMIKQDFSKLTCKEIDGIYDASFRPVRDCYRELEDDYRAILIPKVKERGEIFRTALKNMIKSGTNHIIDNIKKHSYVLFTEQLYTVLITRVEWRTITLSLK